MDNHQKRFGTKTMARAWAKLCTQLSRQVDQVAYHLLNADKLQMGKQPESDKLTKTRLSTPEEEVKRLITTAASLDDIWQFFLKRLKHGSDLDFMCFSVLDERGDFIRVPFLYGGATGSPPPDAPEPILALSDRNNHLVTAYLRKDTTFCGQFSALGDEILALFPHHKADYPASFNLFSIPLIAGDQTIAMLTMGFQEMDSFSQAKLSYVYTLRDQVAQLIWNLVLQDRMKTQAQIDNLTGLLSYTYFQGVLDRELAKADQNSTSVSLMMLDINNLQEINQRDGHAAGDEAICYLASTVRRLIRGLDTVARYGGDEVVVVLPETGHQSADEIAERFMDGLQNRLSVSIGYATYPDDTKNREKLIKLAEQALHLAKFKGSKTGEATRIASSEISTLNDKTVIEVFASQVAKKYNNIHVPSIYQDLVSHIENKDPGKTLSKPDDLMLETVTSLAGALEAKDRYTRGHSQAVANYAVALAHALKMSPMEIEEIRAAAFLHDIGKIGIPESILSKAGPLNEKEWDIMKQHPVIGAQQILYPVQTLRPIIPAVECHHENWDGSGHPHGLKGKKIPLGARVISIVDAFHALTSERAYRKALPVYEAKKILEAGAGTKWDPHLIDVFFRILTIASPNPRNPNEPLPEPEGTTPIIQTAATPVQLKLETDLSEILN